MVGVAAERREEGEPVQAADELTGSQISIPHKQHLKH